MSDFEQVQIQPNQFKVLESRLNAFGAQLQIITERLGPVDKDKNIQKTLADGLDKLTVEVTKWLSIQDKTIQAGFALIAETLTTTTLPTPQPEQEGQLMARYKFNEDQEPVSFTLVFRGGQTKKGTAVGAGDIDLAVSSSSAQLLAEIGPQTLSEDGNEVSAPITLTGQTMPNAELAVVTYTATNRDTGNQAAADVDEFETGPGEVAIGTLDSPVPLEEIPPV